jgi:outer membrane protein OmpA-like peptidoglycan-associated protein
MRTTLMIFLLTALLMLAGCGVKQQFVLDEIAASEARSQAEIGSVKDKVDMNAEELTRLQGLATALDKKADLAINKASGFENYQIIWSGEINFSFDSYDIDDVAASILDEAGMKMEQVPGSLLEIVGHADQTGAASYNLLLGEKRANSSKRFLAGKFGISLYRMFVVSYGEAKPAAISGENQSASKNRRVSLSVWGALQ